MSDKKLKETHEREQNRLDNAIGMVHAAMIEFNRPDVQQYLHVAWVSLERAREKCVEEQKNEVGLGYML